MEKTLGQRLKELRTLRGVTQEKVAEDIGVSHNTYVRYENDLRFPTSKIALKLSDYYGISMKELFIGPTDTPKQRTLPEEEDIRFALSSGDQPITPAQYKEVKQFVKFIQERDRGNI